MRALWLLPILGSLVVLLLRPVAASGFSVSVDLDEPAGQARTLFPAAASIPLPAGRLRDPAGLQLLDDNGRPGPVQLRVLERWPDHTVRWLLVDFLATLPAHGRRRYTLRDAPAGTPPGPRIATALEAHDSRRTLDTGGLRVTVDAAGGSLIASLGAGSGAALGPIPWPLPRVPGNVSAASTPRTMEVETAGPVRTELLLRQLNPGGIAQDIRLAVFAGQRFLRCQQTITNLGDADMTTIEGLPLVVPGTFATAELGFERGSRRFPALTEPHVLAYPDDAAGRLDDTPVGGDGWLRATTDSLAVTLLSRYPAQEYPQALTASHAALRLDLMSGGAAPVPLGSGAAKTFEWWIVVEPAERASPPAVLAAMLRHPLVATVAPDQVVGSQALENSLAPTAPGAAEFLGRFAGAARAYLASARTERWDDGPPRPCDQRQSEHPRRGFTGALNWGDWNFPGYRDTAEHGCDPWGNLEYDLPQSFGLAFAATGDRLFYDALVPAIRHYRDVDIIHHWAAHPEWVGLNHPHKPMHFAFSSVHEVDLGHAWLEGLLTHWRLTGETRSLEAARGIADVLARMVAKAGNPRQLGWPMIALAAAAQSTGETRYLDAARAYADRALQAVKPDPSAGDWKMGILADGMRAVDAAGGTSAYRSWLDAYAAALLAAPERYPDPRFALPIGYLAARTGNPRYRRFALDTVHTMPIGMWGKPLALAGRTGFRLLAPLQDVPRDRRR